MAALSAAEVAKYHNDGYVIPEFRLSDTRVAALRSTLDEPIRFNPDVRPERLVSAHLAGKNAEGVRGSREFLDLARDSDIVDLVSNVRGYDGILWGCQVFCEPAGDGFETPWHQDGHCWPIRPAPSAPTESTRFQRSSRTTGTMVRSNSVPSRSTVTGTDSSGRRALSTRMKS